MEEFLKRLAERLGLKEDATQEQILDELTKKSAPPAADPPKDVITFTELSEAFGMSGRVTKEDLLDRAHKAAPPEGLRMRQLSKQFPEEYKILEETRNALSKEQLARRLDEWHRGGDFGGIAPVLDEEIGDFRDMLAPSQRQKFDEFVNHLLEVGLVPAGEIGSGFVSLGDAGEEFAIALSLTRKENPKLSLDEAVRETAKRHPQLAENYRKMTQRMAAAEGRG